MNTVRGMKTGYIVNVIWHKDRLWRFRCGDCGNLFETTCDPIAALQGFYENRPLWLPLCPPCRMVRHARLSATNNPRKIAVVEFLRGKPQIVDYLHEVTP